jgi:hypothetical protein
MMMSTTVLRVLCSTTGHLEIYLSFGHFGWFRYKEKTSQSPQSILTYERIISCADTHLTLRLIERLVCDIDALNLLCVHL